MHHAKVKCGATRDKNAYVTPATSKNPLVGFTQALFSRNAMTFFNPSVAVAANNRGATYPEVYVNKSALQLAGSPLDAAYASNVAKIGVAHGDAASANTAPAKYACSYAGTRIVFGSKFAPKDGNETSMTFNKFNPMTTASAAAHVGKPSPTPCPYAAPNAAALAPSPRACSRDRMRTQRLPCARESRDRPWRRHSLLCIQ